MIKYSGMKAALANCSLFCDIIQSNTALKHSTIVISHVNLLLLFTIMRGLNSTTVLLLTVDVDSKKPYLRLFPMQHA